MFSFADDFSGAGYGIFGVFVAMLVAGSVGGGAHDVGRCPRRTVVDIWSRRWCRLRRRRQGVRYDQGNARHSAQRQAEGPKLEVSAS